MTEKTMSKKKPNGVQLLLRAVVKDPEGKVLSDTGQKPAKSFVIQFLEFIGAMFKGDNAPATDVSGAETIIFWAADYCEKNFRCIGPINNSNYGIVVGTGDTAATNTDNKLETQLTEGVGAGNITHGVMVFVATAVVGANVDMELKRAFTNNTGSAITVKEAGLYCEESAHGYYHCLIRDVLSPAVDVPDRCSLTVYYTIRTTV